MPGTIRRLLLRGDSESTLLDAGGRVIGPLPNLTYEEQQIRLETVNTLLAYTDGISEAMTADEEEWVETRMIRGGSTGAKLFSRRDYRHIFAEADQFTKGAPQHDDVTLLLMKVEGFYRL